MKPVKDKKSYSVILFSFIAMVQIRFFLVKFHDSNNQRQKTVDCHSF